MRKREFKNIVTLWLVFHQIAEYHRSTVGTFIKFLQVSQLVILSRNPPTSRNAIFGCNKEDLEEKELKRWIKKAYGLNLK